jgi:hypothetical protein
MEKEIEAFKELILNGQRGGRFHLTTPSNNRLQLLFFKSKDSNKFVLQAYENTFWLWTSHSATRWILAKDFEELINEYLW